MSYIYTAYHIYCSTATELLKTNKQKMVRKVEWLHYHVMNAQSLQRYFWQKKGGKKKPKRIFRIRRIEVIAWKHQWGLRHKRAFCFWLLFPRCAEGNFTSTVGEWLQSRRTDKKGEGGRQFAKEQQPSRVPSAGFMKCSQFQRKVAQEKVVLGCVGAGRLSLLTQWLTWARRWGCFFVKWLLSYKGHDRDETAGECKIDSLTQVITWLTAFTAAWSNHASCWGFLEPNRCRQKISLIFPLPSFRCFGGVVLLISTEPNNPFHKVFWAFCFRRMHPINLFVRWCTMKRHFRCTVHKDLARVFFILFFIFNREVADHLEPKSMPETFKWVPAKTALATVWKQGVCLPEEGHPIAGHLSFS